MAISRDMFQQISRMLRPLSNRVANSIARAVVLRTDDSAKMQLLQISLQAGETRGGAERFQPYGFSSVPLPGAEAVTLFPNGDRARPLVIAVDDRRHRPTGQDGDTVTMYNSTGAKIFITKDGDIEVQPAPGREVLVRSEGGSTDQLVTKADFENHVHATAGTGTPSPPIVNPAAAPPYPSFVYTTKLKAE